jgi:hypothetical protein
MRSAFRGLPEGQGNPAGRGFPCRRRVDAAPAARVGGGEIRDGRSIESVWLWFRDHGGWMPLNWAHVVAGCSREGIRKAVIGGRLDCAGISVGNRILRMVRLAELQAWRRSFSVRRRKLFSKKHKSKGLTAR